MVADMDYYRLVRQTDPSYTPRDAVREYLSENKDVAVNICYNPSGEGIIDDMPFDYDVLRIMLSTKDPVDILALGIYCTKPFDFNGYFQFEGDGNLRSMSEREYLSWCFSTACEYADEIYLRKVYVPPEMQRVLDLWGIPPSDMKAVYNRKPAPAKKPVKKAPAKKTCSTKKTVSKNVRPKTTAKKKAPAKKPVTRSRK